MKLGAARPERADRADPRASRRVALARLARVLVLTAALSGAVGLLPATGAAQGFDEEFSSPVLDPAWTAVPGAGNFFSLTANPGHLRYAVTAMTHEFGFLNGYAPAAPGEISCCVHNPGLEIHRSFSGDFWTLEAKVDYFLPDCANGRALDLLVHFGPGGMGTYTAGWVRHRDTPICGRGGNTLSAFQWEQPGMTIGTLVRDGATLRLPENGPALEGYYLRIERARGLLTWSYSTDGVNWTVLFSKDLGAALQGLAQRVTAAGHSWFVPAGSYADWDYIRVTPTDTTPPVITPDITGTLGNDGWYTSDVTVSWDVSDPESTPSFDCPANAVTTDTAGETFGCTATSDGGTATESVTIKRDATPPAIEYAGNAGSYTVDQNVDITCTAEDALSGLATNTCADVSRPAYSFSLGTNTFSASATDNAGNSASASTSFTVVVTPGSLCMLTKQFVESSPRYAALPAWKQALVDAYVTSACRKLDEIAQRLTPEQKAVVIARYKHVVSALVVFGWLTPEQGAVLKSLADAL